MPQMHGTDAAVRAERHHRGTVHRVPWDLPGPRRVGTVAGCRKLLARRFPGSPAAVRPAPQGLGLRRVPGLPPGARRLRRAVPAQEEEARLPRGAVRLSVTSEDYDLCVRLATDSDAPDGPKPPGRHAV